MPDFDQRDEQLELNEDATSSQLESHVPIISNLGETSQKSNVHWIAKETNPSHESSISVQQLNMSTSSKPSYGGSSYVLGSKHLPTSELIILNEDELSPQTMSKGKQIMMETPAEENNEVTQLWPSS